MQMIHQTEVVAMVSGYLDAIPEQVKAWDQKVIAYLSGNAQAFQRFKSGTEFTKWEIIKNPGSH